MDHNPPGTPDSHTKHSSHHGSSNNPTQPQPADSAQPRRYAEVAQTVSRDDASSQPRHPDLHLGDVDNRHGSGPRRGTGPGRGRGGYRGSGPRRSHDGGDGQTSHNDHRHTEDEYRGKEQGSNTLSSDHDRHPRDRIPRDVDAGASLPGEQQAVHSDRPHPHRGNRRGWHHPHHRREPRELDHLRQRIQVLEAELALNKEELASTRQLMDTRTSELQTANEFLSLGDELSGADIISLVSSLNSEVFQVAAVLADTVQVGPLSPELLSTAAHQAAVAKLGQRIGGSLVQMIIQESTSDAFPTLLQSAIQSAILACVEDMLVTWKNNDQVLKQTLHGLYQKVESQEAPPVARRWRALTRKASVSIPPSDAMKMWKQQCFHSVKAVLTVAGWVVESPEDDTTFTLDLFDKLAPIAQLAWDLDKAVNEQVTSMDLNVIVVKSGKAFGGEAMVDAQGEEVVEAVVLATTDMGLYKETWSKVDGEAEHVEKTMHILLPATVVLQHSWNR